MTAAVEVTLDTRGPVLEVDSDGVVSAPEVWSVVLVSDEPLGSAHVALIDSLGTLVSVGSRRVGDRRIEVAIPTIGVATGSASLLVRALDLVGNAASTTIPVQVRRERGFEVSLTLMEAFEIDFAQDRPYEVLLEADPVFSTTLEVY